MKGVSEVMTERILFTIKLRTSCQSKNYSKETKTKIFQDLDDMEVNTSEQMPNLVNSFPFYVNSFEWSCFVSM